jgi:two-component system, OmpR family, response regulator
LGAKRILVVEDDVHIREMLVDRLREHRHSVEGAATEAEAFRSLARGTYDVIVIDLIMNRDSQVTLVDRLLGGKRAPRCIVISGVADLWKRAHPDAAVVGVLQKPFELDELLQLLEKV